MKKREDGYVLAYVVVVIAFLCVLATGVCTIALRNLQSQQASVERTRQLYAAEGRIEQFAAEVEVRGLLISGVGGGASARNEFEKLVGETDGISIEGLTVTGKNWETDANANTLSVTLQAVEGDVVVTAEMQMVLDINVTEEKKTAMDEDGSRDEETVQHYSITGVTLTYGSYVVTAQEPQAGEGGEAG